MTLFKEYAERDSISRRVTAIQLIIVATFILFIISFWSIQIIHHREYLDKAENNKLQIQEIQAARGIIYDRNGIILADSAPSFTLIINRSFVKQTDKSIKFISGLLHIEDKTLNEHLIKYQYYKYNRSIPLLEYLDIKQVSLIEARKYEHPEFSIQAVPQRVYPFSDLTAHTVGYVGEISKEQLESKRYPETKLGHIIGQYGLEANYDEQLRGISGEEYAIINSTGAKVGEISSMRKEPKPGRNIMLTLDIGLQQLIAQLYKDKMGAAVALQPKTGEIIAYWSSPAFDPNHFIPNITREQWKNYSQDENFPLLNKIIQGRYSPGSVFKLVIALTALLEKKISSGTKFFCPGHAVIYGNTHHCWKPGGHGWLDLKGAITHSCNVYFYNTAKLLDIDTIAKYAHLFGFGQFTNIDLNNEIKGTIPDSQWKLKTKGTKWYPGETISVGVGQGPISITPIQMATFISLIANDGKAYEPHLLKSIISPGKQAKPEKPQLLLSPPLDEKLISFFKEALWSVVNAGGTGGRAAVPGLNICGKTGTVELLTNKELLRSNPKLAEKFKDHSWFVGFAPKDDPQLVVIVFVEHGGFGGETAAPIAKEIFHYYFRDSIPILAKK